MTGHTVKCVHICLESVYSGFTRKLHPPTTTTGSGSDQTATVLTRHTSAADMLFNGSQFTMQMKDRKAQQAMLKPPQPR